MISVIRQKYSIVRKGPSIISILPLTLLSRSAEVHQESMSYMTSMKKLITNKNYIAISLAVGGAVGYFNCLATQLQQFMCSRGYSDQFSGK